MNLFRWPADGDIFECSVELSQRRDGGVLNRFVDSHRTLATDTAPAALRSLARQLAAVAEHLAAEAAAAGKPPAASPDG